MCLILSASCLLDNSPSLELKDNSIALQFGDAPISIEKPTVQIIDSQKKPYQSLNIKSTGGDVDILITLYYAKNLDPVGIHLLDGKDANEVPYSKNMVLVYEKNGNMLNAYNSKSCRKKSGQVEITDFDLDKKILSGTFISKICAAGGIGLAGHKEIERGAFKNVPFQIYKTNTSKKGPSN